jgi:hypothetical protein
MTALGAIAELKTPFPYANSHFTKIESLRAAASRSRPHSERGNDELLRAKEFPEEQTPALAGISKHLSSKMHTNAGVCISNYVN